MPKGLKPVRKRLADGSIRLYWYHRATGKRLKHAPETAEGLLEVRGLDDRAKVQSAVSEALSGSYAALWTKYRDSPEWRNLKPRTRSDYQAVRDWLGEAAERRALAHLTSSQVIALRDKADKEKGRRFANYVVAVMRLTLTWGKERDLCSTNPALGVKSIRRPTGARKVNRAWAQAEVEAFAAAAPAQLLVPFMLGLFAGMRQGDALIVTWSAYDGGALRWIAGKNDEASVAPVLGIFKTVLDAAKEKRGRTLQIAVNSASAAWTGSGFRASFFKRVRALQSAGQLKPGCSFHGLRHTIASWGRDGQASEFAVAAAIGDRSTAMAAIYGRDADRAAAQATILGDVQQRFVNADWKLAPGRLETVSS